MSKMSRNSFETKEREKLYRDNPP